jgi:hypothetical protein
MAYKFLIPGDLEAHIIAQFLNERSAEPLTTILESLELQNIALIKTKLKGRYDTDAIFEASGVDRHYLIIKILVKLVLYDFIRRNAGRKVPDDYVKEADWANKLLEQIKAGKETPDGLPAFVNEDGSTGRIISGNNKNEDFYI